MTVCSAAARLGLARVLAWSLLLGGWLVLGALGRDLAPNWAGGQAVVALWLAVMGVALHLSAQREIGRTPMRLMLAVGAAVAAGAVWRAGQGHGPAMLPLAAAGWGLLLVGVSRVVRVLRAAVPRQPGRPVLPALGGAVIVWWVVGDLSASSLVQAAAVPTALAFAGLAGAWLLPASHRATGGCRAGLFDCALPVPSLESWRRPADWPLQAAGLAMLPMMATLPAMGDWCGPALGSGRSILAFHLGAMLLPALCWGQLPRVLLRGSVAGLLGLGLLALWLRPGIGGLMTASLLHAAAWSVAWSATMRPRSVMPAACTPSLPRPRGWPAMLAPAAAILLLGLALSRHGPAALIAAHAVLALVGIGGGVVASSQRLLHRAPAFAPWAARFTSARARPAIR